MNNTISSIFQINISEQFERVALEIFRFQAENIPIYKEYIGRLGRKAEDIDCIDKIPFLPIQFFKTREIKPINRDTEVIFTSSGTTGDQTSKHYITDTAIYANSFTTSFNIFYGNPNRYCILALLPSYLERQGSSLVYMVDKLIKLSNHPESGFFLNEFELLAERLKRLDDQGQKCLLIGVSFALVEFAEKYQFPLTNSIIMETGGMKGRRKEMVREELHSQLCSAFCLESIHSEYGMTELLSQAYSDGNGIFHCPPWMKIVIRDPYDPFTSLQSRKAGAINIIDLANIYSCSFIQTEDLGKLDDNGSFEVIGRMNDAQLRGCNLLVY
jgi:phenylacetate-coenzyme A ligase PaaK-like adenylate-forming protein